VKTVVTGAAGFIGSHVVDALRKRGHDVIGIDSLDPGVHHGPPAYLRSDVDYCFADLRHWVPDERFNDTEAVVHLAALGGVARASRERANILQGNVGGTARLAEAASGWPKLRKIVSVSSFSIYGSNYRYRCSSCGSEQDASRRIEDLTAGRYEVLCRLCGAECRVLPITEATASNPLETYGASKYMQELCFRGFGHCPVNIVRLSSVYGDRLRLDDGEATIIAKLAGWIRSGVTPKLLEDGRQLRDWVYVGDVVDSVLALLHQDVHQPVINICSGVGTTLLEACARLSEVIGVDCTPKVVGGFRPGDMRHCLGDPSLMRSLLRRDPIRFHDGAERAFQQVALRCLQHSSTATRSH
jgi:dTDP-L-rhamnose 4-epimerase